MDSELCTYLEWKKDARSGWYMITKMDNNFASPNTQIIFDNFS